MNKELFNKLLSSVEEAGKIVRSEKQASRKFNFVEPVEQSSTCIPCTKVQNTPS
ncbi:MAG: hypothetical protein GQ582_00410 [Methyloprofundus sp.]|nr:hypothetical protein [Methyloprofundus sp.]